MSETITAATEVHHYRGLNWHRPACGSHRVTHHLLGGPDSRTEPPAPDWVQWQGCLPAYTGQTCEECEAGWYVEDDNEEE